MKVKSFAFFGDILAPIGKEVSLFGNYVLTKPTKDELDYIKQHTDRLQQLAGLTINRYECARKPTTKKDHSTYDPLPQKDWRYYVVKHNETQLNRIFPLVTGLSQMDLTVLMEGVYADFKTTSGKKFPEMLHSPLKAVNFFLDNQLMDCDLKSFGKKDLAEMEYIHKGLIEFEKRKQDFNFISKALDDFLTLQSISNSSPFKILNYFSIFELLMTTYRPGRSQESTLNSQLQNKLTLINNRLPVPIDVKHYFKGPDTLTLEIILAKLYEYRNNIAHGNESDFDKDLQIIGSNRTIKIQFLRNLLKAVLIVAICEPVLIRDLKKC